MVRAPANRGVVDWLEVDPSPTLEIGEAIKASPCPNPTLRSASQRTTLARPLRRGRSTKRRCCRSYDINFSAANDDPSLEAGITLGMSEVETWIRGAEEPSSDPQGYRAQRSAAMAGGGFSAVAIRGSNSFDQDGGGSHRSESIEETPKAEKDPWNYLELTQ